MKVFVNWRFFILNPLLLCMVCCSWSGEAQPLSEAKVALLSATPGAVTLAPAGGYWPSITETNLAYSPGTNRVVTLVRESIAEGSYRIVQFDASTNAFAGGVTPKGPPGYTLEEVFLSGIAVSPNDDSLFINWGSLEGLERGTERDLLIGVERYDLRDFPTTDSEFIPIPFHHFDVDATGNRLVGIADPRGSETGYVLVALDLETNLEVSRYEIGIATPEAIPRDAVFDPLRNRLLVLFLPTMAGEPDLVEFMGFVAACSVDAASVTASATFEGEFFRHALALSAAGRKLAVIPKDSPTDIPILNADTLSFDSIIPQTSIAQGFQSAGAGAFPTASQLWIVNQNFDPPRSLAVYDFDVSSVDRFIPDADRCQAFEVAPDANKVFVASEAYQQIYVFSATSTTVTTQVDFSLLPGGGSIHSGDLAVDPAGNTFQVLSRSGGLHLIEDTGPTYLGRLLGYAPDPQAGLVSDPARGRLIVGRRSTEPPVVLETIGYQEIGQLPVPANALTLDGSRNLIYSSEFSHSPSPEQRIHEIDGETFQDFGVVASLDAWGPPADLVVDPERQALWVLEKGFLHGPRVWRFALGPGVQSASYEFVGGVLDRGRLILDSERGRILVVPFSSIDDTSPDAKTGLFAFDLDTTSLSPTSQRIDLAAHFAFDAAMDPENDLVYLLLHEAGDWRLAAVDLQGDALLTPFSMGFMQDNEGRLAYNPNTDRFAILSGSAGRVFLFDNPFAGKSVGKENRRSKGLLPNSGSVGQATAGIELTWEIAPQADPGFRGVFLERRRFETEPWIRLTPIPIPPTLNFWTDLTAEQGIAYQYQLRPADGTGDPSESIVLSATCTATAEACWPWIPEVVVCLKPGEQKDLLFNVSGNAGQSELIHLQPFTDPPLEAHIEPRKVPIPGTARLTLSSPVEEAPTNQTQERTVWIAATSGDFTVRVPLLVRVVPEEREMPFDRVPRKTTPITLTSDSDLDQGRLSVRGQLGILRTLAKPVPMIVTATLPDGSTETAEVVASTGEFTADFSVLQGMGPGKWVFQATLPGSVEVVGGRSLPFALPVFPGELTKEDSLRPFDFGQIVLIPGMPLSGGKEIRGWRCPHGDDTGDCGPFCAQEVQDSSPCHAGHGG